MYVSYIRIHLKLNGLNFRFPSFLLWLLFDVVRRHPEPKYIFFNYFCQKFQLTCLTSERSERVSYRVEHETAERNSISTNNHVLFCLLYKHLTNKKKTLLTIARHEQFTTLRIMEKSSSHK